MLLLAVSLALVSAALVTWPNASSTAGPLGRVEHVPTPAAEAAIADAPRAFIAPRRDPFGERPSRNEPRSGGSPAARSASVTATPLPPVPGIPVLPANAGAGLPRIALAADEAPTNAIVRAVVTGDHAFALVEVRGAVRIVARGDRIGGGVVAIVDAAGILLDSGKRLSLESAVSADRKGLP